MQGHRLHASVSRSAKRRLYSLCMLQHSWEKLRIGTKTIRSRSNNSACTPQRLFSNLAPLVRISHFAINIIMAPNRQSKFRQILIQKFQQSAKINSRQSFRPCGVYKSVTAHVHSCPSSLCTWIEGMCCKNLPHLQFLPGQETPISFASFTALLHPQYLQQEEEAPVTSLGRCYCSGHSYQSPCDRFMPPSHISDVKEYQYVDYRPSLY